MVTFKTHPYENMYQTSLLLLVLVFWHLFAVRAPKVANCPEKAMVNPDAGTAAHGTAQEQQQDQRADTNAHSFRHCFC